jgi:hypothetical protein
MEESMKDNMDKRAEGDVARWMLNTHGGHWDPTMLEIAAGIAATLNASVRDAAKNLPLEREPADYLTRYCALADRTTGNE